VFFHCCIFALNLIIFIEMKSHRLSFGEIIILKDNLAEVIINEGVLMDIKIVEDYHQFLLTHLKAPFSLLINKRYPLHILLMHKRR
tara:strand:+ start:2036 stop:2293 length:258 start_codon:yes stop_codon:yes gene_type:complete